MRFLDVCIVSNRSASSSTLCHVQGLLRKGRPCLDRVLRLAASLIVHKNRTSQICNIKSLARSLCNIPTIPRYQESVGISFSTLHCLACFPSSGAMKSQPPWPGDQFHPHGEQATLLPWGETKNQPSRSAPNSSLHAFSGKDGQAWCSAWQGRTPQKGSNLACSKYRGPSQVVSRRISWRNGNLKKFPIWNTAWFAAKQANLSTSFYLLHVSH